MVFSMPPKKVVIPRLKLADTEIESVDQFNFLGITLDNHLNAHINKLFWKKISRNTGILNEIKLFLPSRILKTIFIFNYLSAKLRYTSFGSELQEDF